MINNRQQSGRRRGRGGQGGQRQQNGRPEMGNRIDNRARGNAAQLLEKYKTLARDAQQSGDRVLAEYYLQFADHYFRVLAESRARYEEANPRAREQRYEGGDADGFDSDDGDTDDGDEFDARPQRQQRDDRPERSPRDDRPERAPREDRYARDDSERAPRQDREAYAPREAARDDRPRRDDRQPRDGNRDRMAMRPRPNGNGNGTAHETDDGDVGLPFDALPPAIGSIGPAPMEPVEGVEGEPVAAPPRRRGRPRKVVEESAPSE